MAIAWSDELLVGNEVIDRQHREIFKNYNEFLAACKLGKGRDKLLEMLGFMANYVNQHFAAEEQLMAEVNYPDMFSHKVEHRDLRALIATLRSEAEEEGATLGLMTDTNRKLLDWLIVHIKQSDKSLASYVNAQWGLL